MRHLRCSLSKGSVMPAPSSFASKGSSPPVPAIPPTGDVVRSPSVSDKPAGVSDMVRGSWRTARGKHRLWLCVGMASLLLASCKSFSVVNPDDAILAGEKFWHLLQT